MAFIKRLQAEFTMMKERDPSIKSMWEVWLYPGYRALQSYRRARRLYLGGHYVTARFLSQRAAKKTGIEIHPGAVIGRGFFIDHGCGVVIGETTVIGDNVTLYQGVTLGGTGKERGKRHPTLCDNVMVSAGARVLGSITIGENSKIGAGSVVLRDVPANSTVVGVPGQIVRQNNQKVPRSDMSQVDLPDPIMEHIKDLQASCEELRQMCLEIKKEKESERKHEGV